MKLNKKLNSSILFLLGFLVFWICKSNLIGKNNIADSANKVQPILIGTTVPDVKIKNIEGKEISLKELLSQKPTVLIFYRGGWCPFCNRHLGQIKTVLKELKKIGYQTIAVSPDKPSKLVESIKEKKHEYTLFSDSKMDAAKAFGICYKVDDNTNKKYKKYGIDLDASSGENHHLLPVPSVFIINKDGIIAFKYVNPNYKIRLDPDILIAAAHSIAKKGNKSY